MNISSNAYPFYFSWGEIRYIFGCDIISFGLVMLKIWICVLIIMASESIYYYNYFRGFFVFIIVILILVSTFRRIRLFTFYLFFERRLIPTLFLILGNL